MHRACSGRDAAARKGSRFDGNALYRRRYWRRAMFDAIEAMRDVAAAENVSLVTLAYAFVLRHPGVDSVLIDADQIVGALGE